MSNSRLNNIFFLLFILISTSNCRKDINLPDPEMKTLFGTWNWIGSSGGFGGANYSQEESGYKILMIFDKKGILKIYKNGRPKEKVKFVILNKEVNAVNNKFYTIKYSSISAFKKDKFDNPQTIWFEGSDKMYINEDCADCFIKIFKKEK